MLKVHYPQSEKELEALIKGAGRFLFSASQTSTVIPFTQGAFQEELSNSGVELISLAKMPKSLSIENEVLSIRGAVTWEEARAFVREKGFELLTWPTEQSAQVLAGLATSATGERSFSGGGLRDQVIACELLTPAFGKLSLKKTNQLKEIENLAFYQSEYERYLTFKNGPYPRLQFETDLAVGSEGQLGVILSAELKLRKAVTPEVYLISLPHWREDIKAHLEIFDRVQSMREKILSVEFIDQKCIELLEESKRPPVLSDVIVIEVIPAFEEEVIEEFSTLELTTLEMFFKIPNSKYHELRIGVPRAVAEYNSVNNLTKKGTDVQVSKEHFKDLLTTYQKLVNEEIAPSILFGHFGDGHLHLNFLSNKSNEIQCLEAFDELYKNVLLWKGSPFAEHGIGILKQKFIKPFIPVQVKEVLKLVKQKYDPEYKLFPQGFLGKKERE